MSQSITVDIFCPDHIGVCTCGQNYMLSVQEDMGYLDDEYYIEEEQEETYSVTVSEVAEEVADRLLKHSSMFIVSLDEFLVDGSN